MKALVVDDSRAMRLMLSRMLQDLGFEVAQAGHGREALSHLQSHEDTDLALIDWMKPFTRDVIADKLRLLGLAG